MLINLHWNPEPVVAFLPQYQTPLEVVVSYEKGLLGSASTVREDWNWVRDESRFWVIHTDVLTTTNLDKLAAFDSSKEGLLTMGLHPVTNPKDSGLVTLDSEGRVTKFEEKPKHPRGNLAFAGMLLARPNLINFLPERPVLDFGHDIFPRLTGRMWGHILTDCCLNIGTTQRLAEAQRTWPGLSASQDRQRP